MRANDMPAQRLYREAGATPRKRVLLVEGTGDIAFLTLMLDKPPLREENVLADWVITQAGGKDAVLRALGERPDFYALVDQDAWDAQERAEKQREYPHLYILPRFCIENYLVCPDELVKAIPNFEREAEAIRQEIPKAVRHGCLWRAAQPLYDELIRAGFNRALLIYPPPDDREMERMLTAWQNLLCPGNLHIRMKDSMREVQDASLDELARKFIHGKVFWRGCVEEYAQKHFPGLKSDALRRTVFRRLPLPEDLHIFLRDLFLKETR